MVALNHTAIFIIVLWFAPGIMSEDTNRTEKVGGVKPEDNGRSPGSRMGMSDAANNETNDTTFTYETELEVTGSPNEETRGGSKLQANNTTKPEERGGSRLGNSSGIKSQNNSSTKPLESSGTKPDSSGAKLEGSSGTNSEPRRGTNLQANNAIKPEETGGARQDNSSGNKSQDNSSTKPQSSVDTKPDSNGGTKPQANSNKPEERDSARLEPNSGIKSQDNSSTKPQSSVGTKPDSNGGTKPQATGRSLGSETQSANINGTKVAGPFQPESNGADSITSKSNAKRRSPGTRLAKHCRGRGYRIQDAEGLLERISDLDCIYQSGTAPKTVPQGPYYGNVLLIRKTNWFNSFLGFLWERTQVRQAACNGKTTSIGWSGITNSVMFPFSATIGRLDVRIGPGEHNDDKDTVIMNYTDDFETACPEFRSISKDNNPMQNFLPADGIINVMRIVGRQRNGSLVYLGKTYVKYINYGNTFVENLAYFVVINFDPNITLPKKD